jgi:hypothetical protein
MLTEVKVIAGATIKAKCKNNTLLKQLNRFYAHLLAFS